MPEDSQGQSLSGYAYITVRLRDDGARPSHLKVVAPQNCNHGIGMVCETAECLNSWSLDYQFLLERTARGRKIIERFNLTEQQVETLADEEFRTIYKEYDPFDAQYDRKPGNRHGKHVLID